jgi:hypothetical protein
VAASVISICNRALIAIGHDTITSLSDASKGARLCSALYPDVRDEVTRSHPWNSAMRRAQLPALSSAPAWGFARAFQLPADCLRVWRLPDLLRNEMWKVEGRTIVTDAAAPLSILYMARLDDPADMDPLLAATIAARLAMELAMPIADSATLRDAMARDYEGKLREARSFDGQEGLPEPMTSDDLIFSRF